MKDKDNNSSFLNILNILPKKPGVYFFKDIDDKIIYIGKAKNLYNRVRSYFIGKENLNISNPKAYYFADKICSIDYMITDDEVEALILELNLIKKYRPKFNASLRDDKSYPYIVITENETFARLFVTRNRNIKGARYFGPYTNTQNVNEIAKYLRKNFLLRDCKKSKPGKSGSRPCLNYHIRLCSGPCAGFINKDEYKKNIDYIISFLKGRDKKIIADLEKEMKTFSNSMQYENASITKQKIDALKSINSSQKIYITSEDSWDFIAIAKSDEHAAASVFMYRSGEFAGFNNFIITDFAMAESGEILSDFIIKYYDSITNMPSKIFVPFELSDADILNDFFYKTKERKISIKTVKAGDNKKIMDLAMKNCTLFLEKKKFEKEANYSGIFNDIIKIQEALKLKNIPRRIECYDISNLLDSFPVGSMVVFMDGKPSSNDYRHFKIKNDEKQDDFKMIHEILSRRLKYLEGRKIEIEDSFYQIPDLIIIDGGKGQLNAARNALIELKVDLSIDLIGIAKKEETIISDNFPNGINIDKNESYMRLILKIRDETHRFAIKYHRNLRDKNMIRPLLDSVKGIGEKKKDYIYEKYNSIEELQDLSVKELADIKGLTYKDAQNIFDSLNKG